MRWHSYVTSVTLNNVKLATFTLSKLLHSSCALSFLLHGHMTQINQSAFRSLISHIDNTAVIHDLSDCIPRVDLGDRWQFSWTYRLNDNIKHTVRWNHQQMWYCIYYVQIPNKRCKSTVDMVWTCSPLCWFFMFNE